MSLYDYEVGQHVVTEYGDNEFYGLIQACMRLADTDNLQRLKIDWPEVWDDLQKRYNAPRGVLPGEEKPSKISSETKAALEILVSAIQEANPPDGIRAILDSWIRGSDLHPERVGKIEGSSALQK